MIFSTDLLRLAKFGFFVKCISNSLILAFRLSEGLFQMPLEGLSFVETLATLGIIYATDPLQQNVTKIVCLR